MSTLPRFLFRIELLGIMPTIWRRFFVPPDINLEYFQDIVQIVMGWDNSHLWEFTTKARRFIPPRGEEFEDDDLDPGAFRLSEVMSKKGQTINYLYDFGDGWEHKIKMENARYFLPADDKREAGCLDGARACPPEDIGGMGGYYNFCDALTKPGSKQYKEIVVDWFCGGDKPDAPPYDPEFFDAAGVNRKLAKLRFG